MEKANEEENWTGDFPKRGEAGRTGVCGGVYLLSWWTLNSLGLTQGEGFHPCVFRAQPAPGTELVHSQSWSDSEGKERYVTGEGDEMRRDGGLPGGGLQSEAH